jgi:hypothetical protein
MLQWSLSITHVFKSWVVHSVWGITIKAGLIEKWALVSGGANIFALPLHSDLGLQDL